MWILKNGKDKSVCKEGLLETTLNRDKVRLTSGFPSGSKVKNPLARQETWFRSLGWEDPLEKGMATHSSILAWRIPWTEEPGGLQWGHTESDTTGAAEHTQHAGLTKQSGLFQESCLLVCFSEWSGSRSPLCLSEHGAGISLLGHQICSQQ